MTKYELLRRWVMTAGISGAWNNRVRDLLGESPVNDLYNVGAEHNGHYELRGGMHSRHYYKFQDGTFQTEAGLGIVRTFISNMLHQEKDFLMERVEVVVGPAKGGAQLASAFAKVLNDLRGANKLLVQHAVVDKGGEFGYRLSRETIAAVNGKHVLAVDDVIDSGITLGLIVVPELLQAGATVTHMAAVVDRGRFHLRLPVKVSVFYKPRNQFFHAEHCPMCARGEPITQF